MCTKLGDQPLEALVSSRDECFEDGQTVGMACGRRARRVKKDIYLTVIGALLMCKPMPVMAKMPGRHPKVHGSSHRKGMSDLQKADLCSSAEIARAFFLHVQHLSVASSAAAW